MLKRKTANDYERGRRNGMGRIQVEFKHFAVFKLQRLQIFLINNKNHRREPSKV